MKRHKARHHKTTPRAKAMMGIALLILIGAGGYAAFAFYTASLKSSTSSAVSSLGKQPITVVGMIAPVDTVSLSFPTSGTVESITVAEGNTVVAGQMLASLDISLLKAQLAGAQANVAIAQAKLNAAGAGGSSDSVVTAKATLDEANQTLTNTYQSAYQTLITAYSNSNDAVRAKLNSYLLNPESAYPKFVFNTNATVSSASALTDRPLTGTELLIWKAELDKLNATSATSTIEVALTKSLAHFTIIQRFLTEMADVAAYATAFPASDTVDTPLTLQASVAASISEANDAQTSIRNAQQNIASQKIAAADAQTAYTNAVTANNLPIDTSAEKAQVEAARAVVTQIETQIRQGSIRAPMNGTVSVQSLHVGEAVLANTAVITLISKDKLNLHSSIPQSAVGKVNVNDPVSITFDAFPRATFEGVISHVDSIETVVNGSPQYKITVAFKKPDPRMRSGLTAHIKISF
jgi:HlyD family secretion protein